MAAASSSLKEYLKKYESNEDAEKKKKKKKKKQKKSDVTGVLVVDEDPVWQKPLILEEENDDSADEEKPQVEEDIEVKRMKRLEQLKSRRPFGVISEDGSGWVSVSDTPQKINLNDHYPDISPPRKRRSRNDTPSPKPKLKSSSTEITDLSPPRQRRKHYHTPSPESETKPLDSSSFDHHNTNSDDQKADISPPQKWARNDMPSPERNSKYSKLGKEVSNLSPPRQRSHVPDPDLPPPRQVPRGSSNQGYSHSSPGPDLSPPMKSRKDIPGSAEADLSPPRKRRRDFLASPAQDLSLPRKSRRDLSPPRKNLKESTSLTDRPKTGLVTGKDVKEEVLKTKKEEWLRFKAMDPSVTGRGAEPIYRDKITGERISKDQVLKSQKKEEKPKEIKLEWGKGLAQKREAEARKQELELEKAKPFARTRDDPDLDRMMKDRVRWGDPMAHLVKRKQSELVLPDIGDDESIRFYCSSGVSQSQLAKKRIRCCIKSLWY